MSTGHLHSTTPALRASHRVGSKGPTHSLLGAETAPPWSGLVHLGPNPDSLPHSLLLSLSQSVLRAMAVPTGFTAQLEPRQLPPWMQRAEHHSVSTVFSSYTVGPRSSPSPPPSTYSASCPGCYTRLPPPASTGYRICWSGCPPEPYDPLLPLLCMPPGESGTLVCCVLAQWVIGYHLYWTLYAIYPGAVLLVSPNFTAPELNVR